MLGDLIGKDDELEGFARGAKATTLSEGSLLRVSEIPGKVTKIKTPTSVGVFILLIFSRLDEPERFARGNLCRSPAEAPQSGNGRYPCKVTPPQGVALCVVTLFNNTL